MSEFDWKWIVHRGRNYLQCGANCQQVVEPAYQGLRNSSVVVARYVYFVGTPRARVAPD